MSTATITSAPAAPPVARELAIDFLFLDLTTCTRCRGTDRSLDAALTQVADVLRASGIGVVVNRVQVASEEQARALRFVSSPTIRIDGADIALELRESSCGSESCTDGCGEHVDCRVWVHDGREYTEPPTPMIVDSILRHVYGSEPSPTDAPYTVPENLQRFFAGRAGTARSSRSTESTPGQARRTGAGSAACCPPAEHDTCCDAADKQNCCAAAAGEGCGCR